MRTGLVVVVGVLVTGGIGAAALHLFNRADQAQTKADRVAAAAQAPVPSVRQQEPDAGDSRRASASAQPKAAAPKTPTPADWEVPNPVSPNTEEHVRKMVEDVRKEVLADRTSPTAWGKLGAACDAHLLYDCAETSYRRAHQLNPESFQAAYFLAIILDEARAAPEAIKWYRTAEAIRSDYAPLHFRMGKALERQSRVEEALDAYLESVRIDPDFAIGHRNAGQLLLARGEVDTALEHLRRSVALEPEDGTVHAALAQAYRRLGEDEQAAEHAEKSRQFRRLVGPREPMRDTVNRLAVDPATALARAKDLIHAGRHAEAIRDLKIIESASPENATVQVFLGTSYKATGDLDRAVEHLQKAIELDPRMISAHAELTAVLAQKQQREQAMAAYERARIVEPDNAEMHIWVASAFLHHGYPKDAASAYARAEELKELDYRDYMHWGTALFRTEEFEQAVEKYREALRLRPDEADAYFNIGLCLERLDNFELAIQSFLSAVQIDETHAARARLERYGVAVPPPE